LSGFRAGGGRVGSMRTHRCLRSAIAALVVLGAVALAAGCSGPLRVRSAAPEGQPSDVSDPSVPEKPKKPKAPPPIEEPAVAPVERGATPDPAPDPQPRPDPEPGPTTEPDPPAPAVAETPTLPTSEWIGRARRAYREGRNEDARNAAANAVRADPDNLTGHMLRGQACARLSRAAQRDGDVPSAELHALDAVLSLRRASELAPRDPAPLRALAGMLRDQGNRLMAARAYGRLSALVPRDQNALYWHAEMLRRSGSYADAVWVFTTAIEEHGPVPRLVVGAARAQEEEGRHEAAIQQLVKGYGGLVKADKADAATPVLEELWRLTAQRGDYARGEAEFRGLFESHPTTHAPAFMLGSLLAHRGSHAEAVDVFTVAVNRGAGVTARAGLVRSLLASGRLADADERIGEMISVARRAPETADLADAVARAHLAAGDLDAATALVQRVTRIRPSHSGLALLEGDIAFGGGRFRGAGLAYLRALANAPRDRAAAARLHRAALATIRSGGDPSGFPLPGAAAGDAVPSAAPDRSLAAFEEPWVYVRALHGRTLAADGRLVGGVLTVPPGEDGPPGLRIELLPEIDGRAYRALRLRVRAAGGGAGLVCDVLDGYDEPNVSRARSGWPAAGDPVPIGPLWRTIEIPLAEIANTSEARPIPPLLERLRTFVIRTTVDDRTLHFDDVELIAKDTGEVTVLADFEDSLDEVRIFYDGACAPFWRTLFSAEEVAGYMLPGTTPYTRNVIGETFDPAFVAQGGASLRVEHGLAGDGPAMVRFEFVPPTDLSDASALTFVTRGGRGGEHLRVRLVDDTDRSVVTLGADTVPPVRFPRTLTDDGLLTLTTGWQRFRIPLAAYSDVDWSRLRALVFELGSRVGNAPGARIYLDDIGLER